DDYSRYILAWTLTTTMQATDVMATLDLARAKAGVDQVRVVQAAAAPQRQRPVLRVAGPRELPHAARAHPHARGAVSSDDAGEDRAVSAVDEERREARRVLRPVGARTGDRALRRALQPPPAARGAAERDPSGRVRGTAGDDPGPLRADQTRDAG